MSVAELRRDLIAMGFSPELAWNIAEEEANDETDWTPGAHYAEAAGEFNEEGLYHED